MTKNDGTYAQLVKMSDQTKRRLTSQRTVASSDRRTVGPLGRKAVRSSQAPDHPTSTTNPRIVKHRPYSVFADQVRWLNRKKLDIEEEYGRQVTASAMVQLALDLLIADFESSGYESQIVRVLVRGESRPGEEQTSRREGDLG